MFGMKEHVDVQFYTDRIYDRKDIPPEEDIREFSNKLNTTFGNFCGKVEALTKKKIKFVTPDNNHGFHGVPFSQMVYLKPTGECLVNLREWVSIFTVEFINDILNFQGFFNCEFCNLISSLIPLVQQAVVEFTSFIK